MKLYSAIKKELLDRMDKQNDVISKENIVSYLDILSDCINEYDNYNLTVSLKESKKIYKMLDSVLLELSCINKQNSVIDSLRILLSYIMQNSLICAKEDSRDIKTYIIQNKDTKYYKIGKTRQDVNKRIDQIKGNAASDLELICLINKNIETLLHREFKYDKVYSEWFVLTNSDILDISKEYASDIIFIKEFK